MALLYGRNHSDGSTKSDFACTCTNRTLPHCLLSSLSADNFEFIQNFELIHNQMPFLEILEKDISFQLGSICTDGHQSNIQALHPLHWDARLNKLIEVSFVMKHYQSSNQQERLTGK